MDVAIDKVITVLNTLENLDKVLRLSSDIVKSQGVMWEILYVHEVPLFGVPDYLHDSSSLDKEKVKKTIKEHLLKLRDHDDHAIFVFEDDTADRVLSQSRDDTNVLLITPYQEKITEGLIKKTDLPTLVVKTNRVKYLSVVIPIDLAEDTTSCSIQQAQSFFPHSKIRLVYDYRYVVDTMMMDVDFLGVPTEPMLDMDTNEEIRKNQEAIFESIKKQKGLDGDFINETLTIEDDLLKYIETENFDLTVLCSRGDGFLLSDSVTFGLLKECPTDMLIINNIQINFQK